MSIESDWIAGKAKALVDLEAALSVGIPVEMAKRIARWNSTYEYDNFNDMQTIGLPATTGPREAMSLLFSRSESRSNSGGLNGAMLDDGVMYGIFIRDVPELEIDQILFRLDGSPVHLESSEPWDYAGTTVTGGSTRVSFSAGSYIIEAVVTDKYGVFSFEASFEVE